MTARPKQPWEGQGSSAARGYGYRWRKIRERILKRDMYLCQACLRKNRATPATEVHHIKAKAQGGTDDQDNLEASCSPCHREADLRNRGHQPKVRIAVDGWPVE